MQHRAPTFILAHARPPGCAEIVCERRRVGSGLVRPPSRRNRALCRDAGSGWSRGVPLRFATALPLAGYGRGVIVTSIEGRPIKIDGNPRHPASLGSTDVFAEASVLSLYDPDRSKAPRRGAEFQTGARLRPRCWRVSKKQRARQGAGLAIFTARVTSPTLASQIDALQKSLPQAKWYRADPIEDDATRNGATLAFGRNICRAAALCGCAGCADARCRSDRSRSGANPLRA